MGCGCNAGGIEEKLQREKERMNKILRLGFNHGLGDCCHFACLLQLYIRRGWTVKLRVEDNKRTLWSMAGVDVVNEDVPNHPWTYPSDFDDLRMPDEEKNKVAWNLNSDPLHSIGSRDDLWYELCDINIDATSFIGQKDQSDANNFVNGLTNPIALLHFRANTGQDLKDIHECTCIDIQKNLLDLGYSIVILDWDKTTPQVNHPQVRSLKSWGSINQFELAALMKISKLLIGIDSGPYHFARFVPTLKTLGVWRRRGPCRCGLPWSNSRNLVSVSQYAKWHRREEQWGLTYFENSEPTADEITKAAKDFMDEKVQEDIISGMYLYHRVGHDQRRMELRPDHTIGIGAAGCERYWVTTGKTLHILGDDDHTAKMKWEDGKWRGSWLYAEKMPIELTPE